jgi:hypothetical protein
MGGFGNGGRWTEFLRNTGVKKALADQADSHRGR